MGEDWVFNNLVLFSSSKVPHVSTVPNWVVDCPGQWLEPKGLRCSPIRVNADAKDLQRLGYVRKVNHEACDYYVESQSLENRSVMPRIRGDELHIVDVYTDFIPTKAGARVGMTVRQVKRIYDPAFVVVPKSNHGKTQYFGMVREGAFELQFRVLGEFLAVQDGEEVHAHAPTEPLGDDDVIAEISAQRYTDNVSWDGC